jgi:hypothetical protein
LEIWRKAWGWMLDCGATTWWEVFDDRWSQCHYWAGAPTWQMSRRILGIDPTLYEGRPAVRIAVHAGSVPRAAGRVHFPAVGWADVSWELTKEGIDYRIECESPWTLLKQDQTTACAAGTTELHLVSSGVAFLP